MMSLLWIALRDPRDAGADLAKGDDANGEIFFALRREPVPNLERAPRAIPQFGENVAIQ